MKKFLICTLMLCVLTGISAAQPYRPKSQLNFGDWMQKNKKQFSYLDWHKDWEKKTARKKAAVARAYAAIPQNAKTEARIMWWDNYSMRDGSMQSYQEFYYCSVILMDYNEKNGLGTVNVAFKNDCFKLVKEESSKDWFTFQINLAQFNTPGQEESFEYNYSDSDEGVVGKDLKCFKHIKINGADYYQFPMPVRTPALKNGFKKLFPASKKFITAEKASLALIAMPKAHDHSSRRLLGL